MSQQPKKRQPKQPKKAKQLKNPKEPKKKSLGDPIVWTENDLDALSEITKADLKAADALWKNSAPPKLKNLLQAEVQEEEQDDS